MVGSILVTLLATYLTLAGGGGAQATASALKAPSGLKAVAATRAAVELQWSAGDPAATRYAVERKPLGVAWTPPPAPKPSPIMTIIVDGTQTKDASVDPFATYVYRVRAIGAADSRSVPSNEITVGPPPVGFSQIATPPSSIRDAGQFARILTMTLDANQDPAVAYLTPDPDNNGDAADTTLHFNAWDRATYSWKPPVTIGVVGASDWNLRAGMSLSFDPTTNRFGLAHMVGENELRVGFSEDGISWRGLTVSRLAPESSMGGASLVLDRGKVYLAYQEPGDDAKNQLRFRSGLQADPPDNWTALNAPILPKTWDVHRRGISVAVDSDGKPAVTYWLNPSDDYNRVVAYWRPGDASAVRVADTDNHQLDSPDANLTFHNRDPWIAFYAIRDKAYWDNQHQIWVARSTDGGATWGAPVPLPADGGNSMGPPVQIAVSASSRAAVTVQIDGGNSGGTRCGQPKLIQSQDGKAWSVCSAESAAGSPTRQAQLPMIAFPSNGKMYLVFKSNEPGGALHAGLVLWRER